MKRLCCLWCTGFRPKEVESIQVPSSASGGHEQAGSVGAVGRQQSSVGRGSTFYVSGLDPTSHF